MYKSDKRRLYTELIPGDSLEDAGEASEEDNSKKIDAECSEIEENVLPGLAPHWPNSNNYIFRKHFQLKEIPYPYPIWPCPRGHRLPALQSNNDSCLSLVCSCTSSRYAKTTNPQRPVSGLKRPPSGDQRRTKSAENDTNTAHQKYVQFLDE